MNYFPSSEVDQPFLNSCHVPGSLFKLAEATAGTSFRELLFLSNITGLIPRGNTETQINDHQW
jgi:hypothetical protein